MSEAEEIVERLKKLPPEQQREILDFVDFLQTRSRVGRPRRSLAGFWQGFDLSAEEIEQARREMWSAFPREDI